MNFPEYKNNTASISDITNHLNKCNSLFNPPLNTYVDILDYAEKIKKNAVTFEAWQGNELIGLVACYLNDQVTLQGHITNVSVLEEFQNKGIAKNLLQHTINNAISNGFKTLSLEVNVNNKNAIQLYQKLGFILSKRIDDKYSMLNRLNENRNVMVSICCVTYNHENYIREAIDSFLMQKTKFPIEILIHDDASTDGTAEIIKEYENKHPDIIKPIYQTENQYQQGRTISPVYQWPRARGKYIAMCEGDDYWTDPLKLQKQVDFLEKNQDYSICFHPVKISKGGDIIDDYITENVHETTDIYDLARGNYIHTPSVLFKRLWDELPEWITSCSVGDYPLHMLNAQYGKIKKLPEEMAIYRIHDSNIWANNDNVSKEIKRLEFLSEMINHFDDEKIQGIFFNRKIRIATNLAKTFHDLNDSDKANLYFLKLTQLNTSSIREQYYKNSQAPKFQYCLRILLEKSWSKIKQSILISLQKILYLFKSLFVKLLQYTHILRYSRKRYK